ncbi:MAG TPA: NAD(P)/FAD-dependent oxidoreductase [Syntrophorhabdaceae bacterium]|jgi:all-trans-retinol 13,14-reductase
MSYGCAVIGGGVSGMTTAIIMARQGYRTALLESSGKTAPTIRGFTRRGLFFDTGFHYTGGLNEGEPLDIFFRYLGLSGKIEKYSFPEDGFDTFRCLEPRFEFTFPYGYDRIRKQLQDTFPQDARAIDIYLDAVRHVYRSQPYIDLGAGGNMQRSLPGEGQSLSGFLDGITDNEILKCILSMHCLLHGVYPEEVSFLSHACVAGSYYESASGIKGGGSSLSEAFDVRLRELGVEVFCGAEVKEILLSADRSVSGLRFGDDKIINCERCVSTIHPRQLLTLVPDQVFRPVYRKRLETLEDTCSAIILYVESDLPPGDLDRANILLFPSPRFNYPDGNGPVEEKPLFITHARQDRSATPKEGYIVVCPEPNMGTEYWSAPVADRSHAYRSYKESMSRRITAYLETAVPEFRGRISHVECATPLTLKKYTHSPVGSIYGVKHKVEQYNPMPLTKIKNLFLAGQAITAPGIMGAVVSGFLACGSAIGHERLIEELRKWA